MGNWKSEARIIAIALGSLVAFAVIGLGSSALARLGTGTDGVEAWGVAVAFLGVIASTFVGVAAWRTASKATAASSEATRIANAAYEAEVARNHEDRRRAVDDRCADLLIAFSRILPLAEEWADEAEEWFIWGRADETGKPLEPPSLPKHDMVAAANAVLLSSRGDDEETALALRDAVVAASNLEGTPLTLALRTMSFEVTNWRVGRATPEQTLALFRTHEADWMKIVSTYLD